MTKQEQQDYAKELDGLSVDELNARNEELEAQRTALREKQQVLVTVRARRMRADRMADAEARGAQHARPGIAEVKGEAVR